MNIYICISVHAYVWMYVIHVYIYSYTQRVRKLKSEFLKARKMEIQVTHGNTYNIEKSNYH